VNDAKSPDVLPPEQLYPFPDDAKWGKPIIVGVILDICWLAAWGWYLKFPDSVLCTNNPNAGGGFFAFSERCPAERPLAWVVGIGLPILGFLTVAILPSRVFHVRAHPLFAGCVVNLAALLVVIVMLSIVLRLWSG
jgi:hypothetical protein